MTETTIIQLGLGGAALAMLFWFMRWMCKHLDRNNELLDRNTTVINENTKVTKELVTYFKALNGKFIPKE